MQCVIKKVFSHEEPKTHTGVVLCWQRGRGLGERLDTGLARSRFLSHFLGPFPHVHHGSFEDHQAFPTATVCGINSRENSLLLLPVHFPLAVSLDPLLHVVPHRLRQPARPILFLTPAQQFTFRCTPLSFLQESPLQAMHVYAFRVWKTATTWDKPPSLNLQETFKRTEVFLVTTRYLHTCENVHPPLALHAPKAFSPPAANKIVSCV